MLIAGAACLKIEEINVRVFGSELEASFHAMTQAAGMRLDLQIDPDPNVVRSDRRKIRQIITNLVTNAINYRKGRTRPNQNESVKQASLPRCHPLLPRRECNGAKMQQHPKATDGVVPANPRRSKHSLYPNGRINGLNASLFE